MVRRFEPGSGAFQPMLSRTHSRLAVALVVLVAMAGAAPVAAQDSDEPPLADVFVDEGGEPTLVAKALSEVSDVYSVARSFATGIGDDTTATEAADAAQTEFNDHSSAYDTYVNQRTNASTSADVLKVTFDLEATDTRYVVADVNGSDYENVSMVTSTDRQVDESCTLSGSAARSAADELEQFHEEYVKPGENPTATYLAMMNAQYSGVTNCSFSFAEVQG